MNIKKCVAFLLFFVSVMTLGATNANDHKISNKTRESSISKKRETGVIFATAATALALGLMGGIWISNAKGKKVEKNSLIINKIEKEKPKSMMIEKKIIKNFDEKVLVEKKQKEKYKNVLKNAFDEIYKSYGRKNKSKIVGKLSSNEKQIKDLHSKYTKNEIRFSEYHDEKDKLEIDGALLRACFNYNARGDYNDEAFNYSKRLIYKHYLDFKKEHNELASFVSDRLYTHGGKYKIKKIKNVSYSDKGYDPLFFTQDFLMNGGKSDNS